MSFDKRKFAIPYNGANPLWFFAEAEKRKQYIDHIYCELPLSFLVSHIKFMFGNGNRGQEDRDKEQRFIERCEQFLYLSKYKFKRVCPINSMYYGFKNKAEFEAFADKICEAVSKYSVDSLIVTDFRLALYIHQKLPHLELQTSCNSFMWNIQQMRLWRDLCGVKIFNPPRDILRCPSKLKEMHEEGFTLKCLINEGCLIGCPSAFSHQLAVSMNCYFGGAGCCLNGIGDIFRGNWILPRWLKSFDEYVDIYKIAGRFTKPKYPFMVLDAYLSENNTMKLTDLMVSGTANFTKKMLPDEILEKITLNIVPDKILSCECKECTTCKLCEEILSKIIPEEYACMFRYNDSRKPVELH